ncbi:MAG: hypothetical protein ACR2FN_02390 [Chitinophagaceae bacterium]
MKKSLKISVCLFVFFIILSFVTNNIEAQKLVFLYGHGLFATPLDQSSKNRYNYGLGAEAGVGLGMKKTFFVGSIGYTSFNAKGNFVPFIGDHESYIPLKIGIRQYLPLKVIFLDGNLGLGFVNNKQDNSTTRFAFDVGGGVKFAGFEAGINWDNFREITPKGWSSWLAFKAGYRIGF